MCEIKRIIWVGASRATLKTLPEEVQDEIGYALYQAQLGSLAYYAKPLKGFTGVFEIVSNFDRRTYRAVYATKLGEYIYVLHVFQKKSKLGIKTPKPEIDLIKQRLSKAKIIARGDL